MRAEPSRWRRRRTATPLISASRRPRSSSLIKAVLLDHAIEAGAEHHLDVLVGKLPDDHPWKARLRALDRYTPYATAYRYPGSGGRVPLAPDAKQVATDAAMITQWITEARREFGKRGG